MNRAAAIVAALAIVLVAVGCGSSDSATSTGPSYAEKEKAREKREAEARRKAKEKAAAQAAAAQSQCHSALDDFVDHLRDLNSSLAIGMNYADYTAAVRKVRVIYGRIDFSETGGIDCLGKVGAPAEKALNKYAAAANAWGECFDDYDCDNDSVKPTLQRHWSSAERYVDRARGGFDKIKS